MIPSSLQQTTFLLIAFLSSQCAAGIFILKVWPADKTVSLVGFLGPTRVFFLILCLVQDTSYPCYQVNLPALNSLVMYLWMQYGKTERVPHSGFQY